MGGAAEKISKAIGTQAAKLPARIRTRGYDPFTDPQLPADIKALATNLATPSGGATPKLNIPAAGLAAEAVLGEDVRQTFGPASVVVPQGTRIRLSATATGGVPADLADLRVGAVALTLSGSAGGAQVNLRVLDANLPLVEVTTATLHSGGRFQLGYLLVTEQLETAFKALVAVAAITSGQADKLGENPLEGRQPKIHALIDAVVRQHVEQLLRRVILANRSVIASVDLATALGLNGPPGAQPRAP